MAVGDPNVHPELFPPSVDPAGSAKKIPDGVAVDQLTLTFEIGRAHV